MQNADEILAEIRKLRKKLPRKYQWIMPRTQEEREELERNSKFLTQLDNLVYALYEVENAYESLTRYSREGLSEAADVVMDCMRKLYSILGDSLKSEQ